MLFDFIDFNTFRNYQEYESIVLIYWITLKLNKLVKRRTRHQSGKFIFNVKTLSH